MSKLTFIETITNSEFGKGIAFAGQIGDAVGIIGLGLDIYNFIQNKEQQIIEKLDQIIRLIQALDTKMTNLIDRQTREIIEEILNQDQRFVFRDLNNVPEQVTFLWQARNDQRDFSSFQSTASEQTSNGLILIDQIFDESNVELLYFITLVIKMRISFLGSLPFRIRKDIEPFGGLANATNKYRQIVEGMRRNIFQGHRVFAYYDMSPIDESNLLEYNFTRTYSYRHTHRGRLVVDVPYMIERHSKNLQDRTPRVSIETLMTEAEALQLANESAINGRRDEAEYVGIYRMQSLADEWDYINSRIWTKYIHVNGDLVNVGAKTTPL